MIRAWGRWWVLGAALVCAGVCHAAPGLGASASSAGAGLRGSHGWCVLGDPGAAPELLHLPPRDEGGRVGPGTLRTVVALETRPDLIAAAGEELLLATGTRLVGLRAVRLPGEGNWDYDRFEELTTAPPIPAQGELTLLGGTPAGPVVRIVGERGASLWLLHRWTQWLHVHAPDDAGAIIAMGEAPAGMVTLEFAPGGLVERRATLLVEELHGPPVRGGPTRLLGAQAVWSGPSRLPVPFAIGAREMYTRVDGRWVVAQRSGDTLTLWRLEPEAPVRLASRTGIGRGAALVGRDALGTASLVWLEGPAPAAPGTASDVGTRTGVDPRRVRVREISTLSGREMYAGGITGPALRSTQLQWLAMALSAVMALALMYVLRSEDRTPVLLPRGTSLAPVPARVLAWVIDLVPGVVLASIVLGVSPGSVVLSVRELSAVGGGGGAIILAGLIAMVHSAAGEALTGRSLGKRVMGLGVAETVRAGPEVLPAQGEVAGSLRVRRAGVRAALVRAVFRWPLAPLAALALLDPNGRHPGDVLARAVVVRLAPRGDDESGPDNPAE